jgi:hypothetical protein
MQRTLYKRILTLPIFFPNDGMQVAKSLSEAQNYIFFTN